MGDFQINSAKYPNHSSFQQSVVLALPRWTVRAISINSLFKSQYWAYDDGGIDQVGCAYTAQGFEFDYAGVIFGTDLKYNPDTEWEGDPNCSYDGQVKGSKDFLQLVKNTYRVLLGRGMKACYVYFMDKDTERFFRSRIRK